MMPDRSASLLHTLPLLLLLLTPLHLFAQPEWEHLPEPFAGNPIITVDIDEGILLTTEFEGLYLSRDDGRTWEPYGMPDGSPIVIGELGDGSLLAVTDDEAEVFRLVDGATSVELANEGLAGTVGWGIVADNDSAFLLTTEGLYISGDHARSWRRLGLDYEVSGDFASVGAHGDHLIAAVGGRAWYSTDLGETFREFTDSLPSPPIGAAFLESGDLLVSLADGLYISRDGAESFSPFGLDGEVALLFGNVSEDSEGYLWIGLVNGKLFRVSPDGTSAERIDLPTSFPFFTRALESGTILVPDNETGLWRSTDVGESFELTGVPYSGNFGRILSGPDRQVYVPISYGLATSTDQGTTWSYRHEIVETEDGSYEDFSLYTILDNGTVVAVGNRGGFYRWYPDGDVDITADVFSGQMRSLHQISENVLVAFAWGSGSYRSTDGGETWAEQGLEARGGTVDTEGRFWIIEELTFDAALQYSTDGGETFERIVVPEFDDIVQIVPAPEGGVLIRGRISNEWAFTRSTDQGETWNRVPHPCPESSFFDIEEVGYGPGLILNSDCGIYFWDRTDHRWDPLPFPLPEGMPALSAGHTGTHLFVGTRQGLYRTVEQSMSVPSRPAADPALSLSVYPTASALELRIRSDEATQIDFEVYTIGAERILFIPDRRVIAGESEHSISLPGPLPAGTYILRGVPRDPDRLPVAIRFETGS